MIHDSCNSAFMTYERISSWWTCFSPLIKNSQLFKNCNMNLRLWETWGHWVPHGELGPLLYQGGGAGGGPMPLSIRIPNFHQVPCYCWASLPYIQFFCFVIVFSFCDQSPAIILFQIRWPMANGHLWTTHYCKIYSQFPICCGVQYY